ncbi:MAG TPA: L-rhamnose/proton symporter RhaT [bacterium]|nr:L-rhamnose/proton symporter RhaT [bacterium]HPN43077.1 L-rhamnose/proton symporter RhaT [bacterium]
MIIVYGFLLVLIAGFFQGTFILPMTMTKKWQWEHSWVTFSLFGMLVFNWIIALILFPNIFSILGMAASRDLLFIILFGAGWGIGAVLFGLGMDKLGMALGYPIIMGIIASLGALIPLLIFFPDAMLQTKGIVLLIGVIVTILGIIVCSQAGVKKQPKAAATTTKGSTITVGLIIAIFAGILSCLPNVGMAFGSNLVQAAVDSGVSKTIAGNIVWSLFFTIGFLVNFAYCLYLMLIHKNYRDYFNPHTGKNILWGFLMAIMWIGSFYLYGISAVQLGRWGVIVGWPLFISLSIIVGNLWGLWKGEWKGAARQARMLLYYGMSLLIVAVIIIAISNSL